MALKSLMLKKNIDKKTAELMALREIDKTFETREAELEAAISEAHTDEEQSTVEEAVGTFDAEKTAHEEKKDALTREIADLESELEQVENEKPTEKPAAEKTERKSFKMEKISNLLSNSIRALENFMNNSAQSNLHVSIAKSFISILL